MQCSIYWQPRYPGLCVNIPYMDCIALQFTFDERLESCLSSRGIYVPSSRSTRGCWSMVRKNPNHISFTSTASGARHVIGAVVYQKIATHAWVLCICIGAFYLVLTFFNVDLTRWARRVSHVVYRSQPVIIFPLSAHLRTCVCIYG